MAWRLARSLSTLRSEIVAKYPGTTVWTIGDEDHANGYSDHNPNSKGVVCAADILNDGGMNLDWFAEAIRTSGHPDLDYVIWRDKIADPGRPWQRYNGAYHGHVHVSVGDGPDGRSTSGYDSTSPWGITKSGSGSAPSPTRIARPTLRWNDNEPEVGKLQRNLNDALDLDLLVDNHFGSKTKAGVQLLQRRAGITEDGIYGPDAADALRDLLEDDMPTADEVAVAVWRYKNKSLTTRDAYAFLRDTAAAQQIRTEQATHTALLKQVLAGQSGLSEAEIAAAVAEGVRQATPPLEDLAAAVAAAVDHDLDVEAVTAALREFYGGALGAGE
jgi:peptidoglycan hydrolase-like protein with peptidoglycan-binding domain